MTEPDFGVIKEDEDDSKNVGGRKINVQPRNKNIFPIILTILLIAGGFFYLSYEGYFKTEINQTQSVEPQINVSPVIQNTYDIKNQHTIVNNVSVKVWIEGNEIEVEVE